MEKLSERNEASIFYSVKPLTHLFLRIITMQNKMTQIEQCRWAVCQVLSLWDYLAIGVSILTFNIRPVLHVVVCLTVCVVLHSVWMHVVY